MWGVIVLHINIYRIYVQYIRIHIMYIYTYTYYVYIDICMVKYILRKHLDPWWYKSRDLNYGIMKRLTNNYGVLICMYSPTNMKC